MKKVTLKFTEFSSDWRSTRHSLSIEVNGKEIAWGSYGGEPEDNIRCRDYAWVEIALRKLAIELGASVDTVELEEVDADS